MKKLLSITLLLIFLLCGSIFALEMQNSRIKLGVDIVGNLKIWTTGGDLDYPQDNNQNIIDNNSFGSTFILVSVDGQLARFGSKQGKNVKFSFKSNNQIITTWEYKGVLFTQFISIHNGSYSENNNLVKVKVLIENKASADKKIGLRIVADPFLGNGDKNPLFVTEYGVLPGGKAFYSGKGFPGLLIGCARPVEGNANFCLNFYGQTLVMPDKLFVGSRDYSDKLTSLDVSRDGNYGNSYAGKSTVSMVWSPKSFYPGQRDGVAYSLGLLNSKKTMTSSVNMALIYPKKVTKNEFWVGAAMENGDKFWKMSDIKLKLKVDSSKFEIVSSKTTFTFGELASKKKIFGWWRVKAKGLGSGNISIYLESNIRNASVVRILVANVYVEDK